MNKKQRSILIIGLFAILSSCAFPPWHDSEHRLSQYSLLFFPPKYYQIDITRLVIEWMMCGVVVAGLFLLLAGEDTSKAPKAEQKNLAKTGRPVARYLLLSFGLLASLATGYYFAVVRPARNLARRSKAQDVAQNIEDEPIPILEVNVDDVSPSTTPSWSDSYTEELAQRFEVAKQAGDRISLRLLAQELSRRGYIVWDMGKDEWLSIAKVVGSTSQYGQGQPPESALPQQPKGTGKFIAVPMNELFSNQAPTPAKTDPRKDYDFLPATPAQKPSPMGFVSAKEPPPGIQPPAPVATGPAIRRVQPVYPEAAKAAGVQGTVVVKVTIDEEGNVIDAKALGGPPLLQQSALDAAMQWKFEPTTIDGVKVKVAGTITFNFTI